MNKKIISMFLAAVMGLSLFTGCGSIIGDTAANTSQSAGTSQSAATAASSAAGDKVEAALSLANASDYYIGTMVGESVKSAFEEAGASTQVLDANSDVATQLNQIQTAITSGVDIIYVFPAGDGAAYTDVLKQAKLAGVKTIMSNNSPGKDVVDAYVGNDEFEMGVMMSAMVSAWADRTYPDAGAEEVPILILESDFNENAIRRCMGMKMVSEKFLREADLSSGTFISKDGEDVTYVDAEGKEQKVDEPSGGLILDDKGHAQLNPYYNAKIKIVESGSKGMTGTDSTEAQKAIDNAVASGETGLAAIMGYGDVGAASDTKAQELIGSGKITTPKDKFAIFCSDLTDTNKSLILKSDSLLKGVMASGDLIKQIQDDVKAMVAGESVDAYKMMALSYCTVNDAGDDITTVYYTDSPQLPDTSTFFTQSSMEG